MTTRCSTPRPQRAFTVVELMIAIAVLGVILTLAAPSFRDFILMQRLKGVNAQLVTDLQFARSEAAARSQYVRMVFRRDTSMTCYSIYTSTVNATRCDCLLGAGSACSGTMREIRTVQLPTSGVVALRVPDGQGSGFAYDHVTGGIVSIPTDDASVPIEQFRTLASIDAARVLQTTVGRTGRVTVCAPSSTTVGAPAC